MRQWNAFARVGTAASALALALALPPSAAPLAAQEVALGAAAAVHPASFSVVNSVRERGDGSILVADPLSRVLVVLSPDLARADTIGRLGGGPREYRQPDAVWALPGDSTLLVDLGNARLTTIDPTNTFVHTRPISMGDGGDRMPPTLALPSSADGLGGIYFTAMPAMTPQGPSDSVAVLRLPHGAEGPEQVTRVKTTSFTSQTTGSADNQNVNIAPIPLSATDVWAAGPDGSVAIARAGEVRVDWLAPDGSLTRGETLDLPAVAIRRAEREEWNEDRTSNGGGIGIEMTVENGARSMRMSRGGMGGEPDLDAMTWPDQKAPWVASSGAVDALGRFWVRRSLPAGERGLYDVFTRADGHVGSVRFPEDRRLVGFGDGSLYVVHVDDFDLQTLEKYLLPEL